MNYTIKVIAPDGCDYHYTTEGTWCGEGWNQATYPTLTAAESARDLLRSHPIFDQSNCPLYDCQDRIKVVPPRPIRWAS